MSGPVTHSALFSERLLSRLAAARRVAVLTGAGISAESGIATFRDPGGLWERFKPEELANVDAFLENPALVQAWYAHRRTIVHTAEPNAGHLALRALELLIPDFVVITQNVDGLHQRAGNRQVIELHGNINRNYCISCNRYVADEALLEAEIALCPHCGGLIRPDVVWFGEALPEGAFARAETAARRADVFLSIGTSALVYPAADLPVFARHSGAYVAEVNLQPSALAPHIDESVLGRSAAVLPELVDSVRILRNENRTA